MPDIRVHGISYSGFLSREKTFANFEFLWRSTKVLSAKIYFQAIRYRVSGRGALGYCKFAKLSPRKSIFKQFVKVFSRERNPLYGNSMPTGYPPSATILGICRLEQTCTSDHMSSVPYLVLLCRYTLEGESFEGLYYFYMNVHLYPCYHVVTEVCSREG